MTFDGFMATITASAASDWVRLGGGAPGRLLFVHRADVATTIELGAPVRLDPGGDAVWTVGEGKSAFRQVDCCREGRVVFRDVVMLAAAGNGLLPVGRNRAGQVGATRRELARLIHRLAGHGGDFDALFSGAGLTLAANEPLA